MQNKIKRRVPKSVASVIDAQKGISLDLGCGQFKRKGAIGMDIRPMQGVDIVHDLLSFPWPIPDEVCNLITASHLVEHLPKHGSMPQIHALTELLISKGVITRKEVNEKIGETAIFSYLARFMDECWRVTKVGGQAAFALPYATSSGFHQDPTHSSPINEATWAYFDPTHQSGLCSIYRFKPWRIEMCTFQVNGFMEVILEKLPWLPEYEFQNDKAK